MSIPCMMWPIPFPLSPFAFPPASPIFTILLSHPLPFSIRLCPLPFWPFHPCPPAFLLLFHPLSFCFSTRIRPLPFCFSIRPLSFCLSIRIRPLLFLPFHLLRSSLPLPLALNITSPGLSLLKAHLALYSLFISIFFCLDGPFYPALTPPPLTSWDHTTDHYRSRNPTSKI